MIVKLKSEKKKSNCANIMRYKCFKSDMGRVHYWSDSYKIYMALEDSCHKTI